MHTRRCGDLLLHVVSRVGEKAEEQSALDAVPARYDDPLRVRLDEVVIHEMEPDAGE